MKKVTLKDIANELGVTVGTVSHVLNGINDISEPTRLRVLETAERLGYVSNNAAVSLRSGRTRTVAVIVPDVSNPHIAHQVKLIEERLREARYSVIILNTGEDEASEKEAILTACGKQVDGILLCPTQKSKRNLRFLEKMEIPFLLIGRYYEDVAWDFVTADDRRGGYLAGEYLMQAGYRRPLYIGVPPHLVCGQLRLAGAQEACRAFGADIPAERIAAIDPKGDGVAAAIEDFVQRGVEFDAVIAFSDLIAFRVTSRLAGLLPDRKIPVVGFDAVNTHLYMPFPHVSVGMVDDGWAKKAVTALLSKINGEGAPCREQIAVRLYEFA